MTNRPRRPGSTGVISLGVCLELPITASSYTNVRMSATAASTDVDPVARLFRALGDPTRLRIVALLSHGELCVCHLEQALGLTQPTVSRHLAVLRAAGVVAVRRDGSWVHYRLCDQVDKAAERQLTSIVESFAERKALAREAAKLRNGSGPGQCT